MKVNVLKSENIVFAILALAVLSVVVVVINMKPLTTIEVFDRNSAEIIRKCITAYIADTNDYELKFGGNKSVYDVDELLIKLTLEVTIEGKKFEPYLLGIDDRIKMPPSHTRKNGYKGWKIVIDKRKVPMEAVSVEPSESNMIEYVDK